MMMFFNFIIPIGDPIGDPIGEPIGVNRFHPLLDLPLDPPPKAGFPIGISFNYSRSPPKKQSLGVYLKNIRLFSSIEL